MAKRRISGREHSPARAKKRKIEASPPPEAVVKDIKTPKDLQDLLFFDQGSASNLQGKLSQFEKYIGALRKDDSQDSTVKDTLLQYLQPGTSRRNESYPRSSPLTPLFQSWSYALQTGNHQLLRAVPSALATLLSAISPRIEFREAGLQICNQILQDEQLDLIDSSLKPSRQKAGALIACLRLLTEIVGFDGGSLALKLSRHGNIYRQIEILLTMSASDTDIPEKKRRYHISIRDCAVRFILANLRYQNAASKALLIDQGSMVRNLVKGLENDPPGLLREVLTIAKAYVLDDDDLADHSKTRFLLDVTLTQVARLYQYSAIENEDSGDESIPTLAHEFLLTACIPKSTATDLRETEAPIEIGQDDDTGLIRDVRTSSSGLVKGKALLILLSKLRPHAVLLQRKLALAIFESHPQLIHDYFKEATFQFDPKLTATWMGYCSFLISVILLPLPAGLSSTSDAKSGERVSNNSIRDSILPPSLHRDVLERCFTIKNEALITFMAVKLLIASFQKLQDFIESIRNASSFKSRAQSMVDWFLQRCPRGRVVIGAFRSQSDKPSLQKEHLSRLLLFYHSLTPQLLVDSKLEVGPIIAEILDAAPSQSADGLTQLELTHLLSIASQSPMMRWWNPGKSQSSSAFVSVLQAYTRQQPRNPRLFELLLSILKDSSVLQTKQPDVALQSLVKSLEGEAGDCVYSFLNNTLFHLSKQDLKYTSMLLETVDTLDLRRDKEIPTFSLLTTAIGQQWSFAVDNRESTELLQIAEWARRYFEAMDDIGESRTIMRTVRDDMLSKTTNSQTQNALQKALPESKRLPILPRPVENTPKSSTAKPSTGNTVESFSISEKRAMARSHLESLDSIEPEATSHPELARIRRLDASDGVDEGVAAQLMRNLSSTQQEVRLQSLSALRSFVPKVEQSSLPFKTQLYLLLNELIETVSPTLRDVPVPSFAAALAAACVPLLGTPLHPLYPKVNDFLLQRPNWILERLPRNWLRTVLETVPGQAGLQSRETSWLLDVLLAGLRNTDDVELYRANGVLERVLTKCQTGMAPGNVSDAVLRLVYRFCGFPAGAMVFVTRSGGLAWVTSELARAVSEEVASAEKNHNGDAASVGPSRRRLMLLALVDRLRDTCDAEHLQGWSAGSFETMLDSIEKRYAAT